MARGILAFAPIRAREHLATEAPTFSLNFQVLPSFYFVSFAHGAAISGLSTFADGAPEAGDFSCNRVFPTAPNLCERPILASRFQPRYNIAGIETVRM
jgi:hypothetical protein